MNTWQRLLVILALIVGIAGVSHVVQAKKYSPPRTTEVHKPLLPVENPAKFTPELFFSVMDGYRIESGIASLERDPVLDASARLHAYDMKTKGYYDHTSPDGETSYQRIVKAERNVTYSGENQDQICVGATVNNEFARFVGSAEHDQNMLDPKYTVAGVGIVPSDPGKCNGYIVVDFATVE